jgi:hypothetical protein
MHSSHDRAHAWSIPEDIPRRNRSSIALLGSSGGASTHHRDVHRGACFAGSPRLGGTRSSPRLALASDPAQLAQLLGGGAPRRL